MFWYCAVGVFLSVAICTGVANLREPAAADEIANLILTRVDLRHADHPYGITAEFFRQSSDLS
jgi:hypothetical protein